MITDARRIGPVVASGTNQGEVTQYWVTHRQSVKQPLALAALARTETLEDPRLSRLYDRRGRHFWQTGKGDDRNIHSSKAGVKSIDTIHNNSVEARLVKLPWEWQWSSAGWYEGKGCVEFEVDCPK